MSDIYRYKNEFDKSSVFEKISQLDSKLREEQNKPADEINDERVFNLIYAQFIEGLKLSTGSFLY